MHFAVEGSFNTPPAFRAARCRCEAQASFLTSLRYSPPENLSKLHCIASESAHSALRRRAASLFLAALAPKASPPDISEDSKAPRLAIFVSGGGSNFRAIHAAVLAGQIAAEVAVSSPLARVLVLRYQLDITYRMHMKAVSSPVSHSVAFVPLAGILCCWVSCCACCRW